MADRQVIAFAGIAGLLTITPGADTMMIPRNVFTRGQKAEVLTMIGVLSGCFVHATLSALGLSLILVRSAAAFHTVKLIGACYLIYLGGRSQFGFANRCRSSHESIGKFARASIRSALSYCSIVCGWRGVAWCPSPYRADCAGLADRHLGIARLALE